MIILKTFYTHSKRLFVYENYKHILLHPRGWWWCVASQTKHLCFLCFIEFFIKSRTFGQPGMLAINSKAGLRSLLSVVPTGILSYKKDSLLLIALFPLQEQQVPCSSLNLCLMENNNFSLSLKFTITQTVLNPFFHILQELQEVWEGIFVFFFGCIPPIPRSQNIQLFSVSVKMITEYWSLVYKHEAAVYT